ncbi:MAG: hypothetical protein Q8N62_04145 [Candidatus Omnitrophota bacterium]|nr:hypothetical protein [Candidatus Omnitrophota bacterium]
MGVVHKLKPEVLTSIIQNKQNNPALSCRYLTALILEQFHIKVSKSSINAIFKENNLSMPIGRRRKQKRKKFNLPALPVIEGTRAIMLVTEPPRIEPEITEKTGKKEGIIKEEKKEEISLEEKRITEAEEWAIKLQEEERIRIEEKLSLEKQRLKAEIEANKRALEEACQAVEEKRKRGEEARKMEEEKAALEAVKIKAEEEARNFESERIAQEAVEEKRKRGEEARKMEEEKATLEAELKIERERWSRIAESELKAKQEKPASSIKEPDSISSLPEERVCSGAILLKILDQMIGGSKQINAAICKGLGSQSEDSLQLVEALIFRSLFGKGNLPPLGDLIGRQYSLEKLDSYYAQIQQIGNIKSEISGIISNVFIEAKGVKVHFIDRSVIHLDGQLHSSWPATRFPFDFSNTVYDLKNKLNKHFLQGQPLVLFSPFGYDIFPKDFFNLLLNIGSKDNYPESLTLFGNQLEELEQIPLNPEHRCALVFGLWPWQFTSSRKVKRIGEFSLKHVAGIDRDLYLGEIEIDLLLVSLNQRLSLKGCAIKTDLQEKIRLVVLNTDEQALSLEELASTYLSHWPNFEEAFHDFSRKIELFSYAGDEQKFLSQDRFKIDAKELDLGLADIFRNYIKMLDLYFRWHFLPVEYTEKDLSFTSECFYNLPVKLISGQNKVKARMLVSWDYQFLKDLEYLNCRLNERQLNTTDGKVLWFESAPK